VKRCASCGREISETATVCDLCERWAADQIQLTSIHASSQSESPAGTPSSPSPSLDAFVSESAAVAPPPAAAAAKAQPVAAPPQPRAATSRFGRREMMIVAAALVIGSAITFALGGSRGATSTTVTTTKSAAAKPASAPAAAPKPAFTQTWSTSRRAYWTANQRHAAAFELPAENTVAIWMNYVRPILVVRCMNKRTETFVYTGSALKIEPNTEDHSVSFHFDGEAASKERWPDSAEHDALFAPDGAAFAHRVLAAKSFRFGYTPHNAEPVEAQFHVDGLAQMLDPAAAKDCGWQK
jgi:hypothetical protein